MVLPYLEFSPQRCRLPSRRYNAVVNWRAFIDFLHRWQWLVAAIAASVPTVYYGPKKLLETWDWYVDRFRDRPILEVLREVRIPEKLAPFSPAGPGEVSPTIISIAKHGSYSVGDLADIGNHFPCGIIELAASTLMSAEASSWRVNKLRRRWPRTQT